MSQGVKGRLTQRECIDEEKTRGCGQREHVQCFFSKVQKVVTAVFNVVAICELDECRAYSPIDHIGKGKYPVSILFL
jgi:hypothetical protein